MSLLCGIYSQVGEADKNQVNREIDYKVREQISVMKKSMLRARGRQEELI